MTDKRNEIVQKLRKKIMEDMEFGEDLSDEQMKDLIGKYLLEKENDSHFSLVERKRIGKEIFDSLRKWDVLQDLLETEEKPFGHGALKDLKKTHLWDMAS